MSKIHITVVIIIFLLSALGGYKLANFYVEVEREQMNTCGELDDTTEAYYECLEQGGLNTWDMNNQERSLNISWNIMFYSFFIMIGMMFSLIYLLLFMEM